MILADDTPKLPCHSERSILIPDLVQFLSCYFPPSLKFSLVTNSDLFDRYPFLVLLDNFRDFDLASRNEMVRPMICTLDQSTRKFVPFHTAIRG